MEYPTGVSHKHNNTNKRRFDNESGTHLRLYGYDENMSFVTERIGLIKSLFIRHHLYRFYQVECQSCFEISKILAKRTPKRWECASCRHSEPEIDFNYQLEA